MTDRKKHLDLATFSVRLNGTGPEYWRSLEELAHDPSFEETLRREFPRESAALDSGVDRRDFMRLMGASLAMGGLAACAAPYEAIVPYVEAPERIVPGKPLFYATAMEHQGVATGLLVETHMGRPTKIEGNPEHPSSLGATDSFAQASILDLWDPDRSQTVRQVGETSTWSAFVAAIQANVKPLAARGGAGLRILTESTTSPTLKRQMEILLRKYPAAVWHSWEPAGAQGAREGAREALGQPLNTVYRFDRADVVLALDSDFLNAGPGSVRYARDFADRRRVRQTKAEMNRLYVAESMPTPTGTMADHRLAIPSAEVEELARAIAANLGLGGNTTGAHAEWAAAVARDLRAHAGRSIVIAGDTQPPAVHAIAHALNAALGNVGTTLYYTESLDANPVNQTSSIVQLARDMAAGRVEALIILGGNPVFTAPTDLAFAAGMQKVPFRVHLGVWYDETSALSHWHVPMTHYLESWGDVRGHDGTVTIVQPLIRPLYNGHSALEVVAAMNDEVRSPYELVRETWAGTATGAFDTFWNRALHDGVVPGTALPPVGGGAGAIPPPTQPRTTGDLELVLKPDPMIWDGRYANNGWLQELPKPITKLTWDNAAHMSPATANARGFSNGDLIQITVAGSKAVAPVWIVPGHADNSITLYYGYGATRTGRVAKGTGYDVQVLRTIGAGDIVRATVERTGAKAQLATVQHHHELSDDFDDGGGKRRDIIHTGTLEQYRANPDQVVEAYPIMGGPSIYPEWVYPGYAWGMVIDTNVCTGCGVCTIACQSENNITVVGKEQVLVGREMHWIRTDHYYHGDPTDPNVNMYNLPVPCMHCENAPCEPVCPVEATTHSDEGLNDMTYNRCVGTRYCANNCPYKVRRFNFLAWTDFETESYKSMRNPDVTVRSRGVMEKCTFCVQRISSARIQSEVEERPIRDGDIVPACAQACPTRAITFGDINDENAEVTRLKREPLNYGLLVELNTQPRTTYLGALKNPNPELAPAPPVAATSAEHGE